MGLERRKVAWESNTDECREGEEGKIAFVWSDPYC